MSGTSNLIRLSVDMMGGDQGIEVTAPGLLDALSRYPDLICHAVGDPEQLHDALSASAPGDRLIVVPSSEVVEMDEPPASALRFKKDSSMRVAINQLSEGRVSGCVSAGNTGALMATARFVLKTLPGIDRPAIIAVLPRSAGHVHMLDLGANVGSPPEVLFQFGLMGSSLVRTLEGAEAPTVGLLNVGSEEIKGSETIKTASEMLRNSDLNYVGYVEGDDIFNGEVDLIVCDGFEGNIALKTSEGLAQMLTKVIREEFTRSLFSKLAALIAKPVLRAFQARIDHRRYNGAMLLGLRGVVIKSHGGADQTAFSSAIGAARLAASKNLISQIESDLEAYLGPRGLTHMLIDARIIGTGSYLPKRVLDNHELAEMVDTSDDWIFSRSGIRQRHIAAPDEFTCDLAVQAAERALESAQRNPEDIDLVIVATTTADQVFPSTACLLQERLGIRGGPAFDVQAVCAGFVYALDVAHRYIQTGGSKCALVIGAETFSRILNWKDRSTCVLFGDGAGAMVIEASDSPGIISSHLHADGAYKDLLCVPTGVSTAYDQVIQREAFTEMKGKEVFRWAVSALGDAVVEALEANNLTEKDIDWLVPHQANIRIIQAIARRVDMSLDKVVVTIERHGNTSAASVPLAFDEAVRDGRIRRGQNIIFEAFGGGFAWGSMLVKF